MPQYSFLEEFITEMLKQNGLGELTEENKKKYLPQLMSEAEYRIGLALMPKLNEADAAVFAEMMQKEENDAAKWQEFWKKAVPDFEGIVKDVLIKFGQECKQILTK